VGLGTPGGSNGVRQVERPEKTRRGSKGIMMKTSAENQVDEPRVTKATFSGGLERESNWKVKLGRPKKNSAGKGAEGRCVAITGPVMLNTDVLDVGGVRVWL